MGGSWERTAPSAAPRTRKAASSSLISPFTRWMSATPFLASSDAWDRGMAPVAAS